MDAVGAAIWGVLLSNAEQVGPGMVCQQSRHLWNGQRSAVLGSDGGFAAKAPLLPLSVYRLAVCLR